jgi:sugar O-acyltransferase (sialic acid O-acetyltransferase NeuD family)
MQRLILVGAGSLARETVCWLPGMIGHHTQWNLAGLLTDGEESFRERGYDEPLLGKIAEYQIRPEDVFVIAIAAPAPRLDIAARLSARGARFTTLIHDTVLISRNVQIGEGTIIFPRSIISCDVEIGRHVMINCLATVGHDAQVGDGCTMSAHSELNGKVRLGRGVFLGSHATVLPRVAVGDFAVLGAGSAVIRSVSANQTIIGVPGKRFRKE